MPNDFPPLTETGVALLATYLLHSTVWLTAAWGLASMCGRRSAALRERLWRAAAILPFLTTAGKFFSSERPHGLTWTLPAAAMSPTQVERPPTTTVPVEFSHPEPAAIAAEPTREAPLPPSAIIIEPSQPSLAQSIPENDSLPPRARVRSAADGPAPIGPGLPVGQTRPPVRLSQSGSHRDTPDAPSHQLSPSLPSFPSVSQQEATRETKDGISRQTGSRPTSGPAGTAHPIDLSPVPTAPGGRVRSEANGPALTSPGLPSGQTRRPGRLTIAVLAGIGMWTLIGLLRVVWIAGSTMVHVRRLSALTDGPAAESLRDLRESRGVRRDVQLLTSERSAEPAALGLWRWTILLPAGIDAQLDRAQLRALLAHELAHLVRGDVWWLWIGRALTAAFGWQPLNRLAVRRWREASEQLCDDWAVAGGIAPLTLAQCLTHVAELRLTGGDPAPGLTVIGRPTRLAARIRRLTGPPAPDPWNTPTRRRLLTAALLSAAAAVTYTGPHIVLAVPSDDPVTTNSAEPSASTHTDAARTAPRADPALRANAIARVETRTGQSAGRGEPTSEDGSPSSDLAALRRDLQRALQLLEATETDPEITALVDRIRSKVEALKTQGSESAQ